MRYLILRFFFRGIDVEANFTFLMPLNSPISEMTEACCLAEGGCRITVLRHASGYSFKRRLGRFLQFFLPDKWAVKPVFCSCFKA